MIEVILYKHNTDPDHQVVLVDADEASLIGNQDQAETNLVLEKDGVEVAWFQSWVYAVKVDSLMEYVDE